MTTATTGTGRMSIREYYRTRAVRQRILEYCGGSDGSDTTCVFLSGTMPDEPPHVGWSAAALVPPADVEKLLAGGADISRSTWDSTSLLVHLDVDYQNIDRPTEPFVHPADVFLKLEPVRRAVEQLLDEFELPMLALMTGRGYHVTGRIPLDSPLLAELSRLAPIPPWFATCSARRPRWATHVITEQHARAYVGMGMLVEHLAHQIMRRSASRSHIPVVLNGTVVGPSARGRECASLDLSYAGDPLDIRHMRVAFSAYQKHRFRTDIGHHVASTVPPVVAVPMASLSLLELLESGREPEFAASLAAHVSAEIPVVTTGASNLLEEYLASPLARFHHEFYATAPEPQSRWHDTYDRLDFASLIPCVGISLQNPNDLLLKPEHVQHVTRFLMGAGWHPRHIAGLVHSRYVKDFGWGDRWTRMDAQARAEFDVRVFAGMVSTGLDEGVDFNCRSAQEKALCPRTGCTHDLRRDRDRLIAGVRR